ncbi:MAG: diaminopimelate epimerase [Bacteroidota bacterium]
MKLAFTKYQGTGNDFVVIDNRDLRFPKDKKMVSKLCDRRFGIGADGLMLIESHDDLDFRMIYFNSDGSQSLCGNGSRCAVSFARSIGLASDRTTFETTDGVHQAFFRNGNVNFQLHDILAVERRGTDFFIHNGSPHHIQFVEDLDRQDVKAMGRKIRYSMDYEPEGTNVNFVEKGETLKVRTYERGVEDETLSCGTGVTAVAIAASLEGYESPVKISTKGGELSVSFRIDGHRFTDIFLCGPAQEVFSGTIEI